ncbi:MAG TPA: septum formation inhibitor Maf [Candidatus Corynebacterium avicola]|uniref:Nucleoside triphosphate pyrophosphatase n=1 Tax=Candidatus Corynebacterium avicola TaxID=2838527 RepID=A0A9D1UMU4_9CORY|nr:septum formation inhibitor Maf [Candidatus Corynebacterium avicola]
MAEAVTPSPRVVLASSSPSRLSVLRSGGIEPLVLVPGVDEDAATAELHSRHPDPSPAQVVAHLAAAKCAAVTEQFADEIGGQIPAGSLVIAGDSMLLLGGELQGKPHTVEKTVARWHEQRGRTASLITGHAFTFADPAGTDTGTGFTTVDTAVSETVVHFAEATDADIRAYAETGEPLACAGAFTLEALGGWFIDRIEGDPSSVIGLSLPLVRQAITGAGRNVSDFWNTDNTENTDA